MSACSASCACRRPHPAVFESSSCTTAPCSNADPAMIGRSSLSSPPFLSDARRGRASSYDTSGGNADFWLLQPGETRTLADIASPGAIRPVWMTLASREESYPRLSVLRMFWDGAETPCVEAPT